jgi:galactokinase
MRKKLEDIFIEHFSHASQYKVHAPGRINLIGEHTDYNNGFVFPIAINRDIKMVLSPRDDRQVSLYSLDFHENKTFSLDNLRHSKKIGWVSYVKAVIWILKQSGFALTGFNAVIKGNIPRGAGLSSSAAFELVIAKAFSLASAFKWDPALMARLCQQAENKWVGVNCGIMDQMTIACGKKNKAMLIDCRDLTVKYVQLPKDMVFVIMDTGTRRGLCSSVYNTRRIECEKTAKLLHVDSLREVNEEFLNRKKYLLSKKCYLRACHIVSENVRVLAAVAAIEKGKIKQFGKLMNASHESLKNDFVVSSFHLDTMVACARELACCYGARMTGAGFGGCAIALVRADKADIFKQQVATLYYKKTNISPKLYVSRAVSGV